MPDEQSWDQCAKRVSDYIASVEINGAAKEWAEKFKVAIEAGDFMPGGRILFGAGRRQFNMLNCYRLHPEDTVESIGKMIRDTYLISCGGGGIGYNFSSIRPKGDDIQNIRNSAPGSVSVMKMVNEIGHHVRSGKNRRTALIAILNVDHPDLFEFLSVKLDQNQLTNFNISIGITNEFIKAVKKNKPWNFKFNGRTYNTYKINRTNKTGTEEISVIALNADDALGPAHNHYRLTPDDVSFLRVPKEGRRSSVIPESARFTSPAAVLLLVRSSPRPQQI
jgi:ribonucleotide reductase alpha subunit